MRLRGLAQPLHSGTMKRVFQKRVIRGYKMQVMVTLPDTLVFQLISQAKSKNLTFNEFLLKTLQNDGFAPLEPQESFSDSVNEDHTTTDLETSPFHFDEEETVTDVVRRIQARTLNLDNIHPPTKTIDELVDDLKENPPEASEINPVEWDQMWAKFENDMKMPVKDFSAIVELPQENWLR